MEKSYKLKVAGLERDLQICKVNDEISIAAFIMFSDIPITIACAEALLKKKLEAGQALKGNSQAGFGPPLEEIRTKVQQGFDSLDHSYKRFLNPHIYKVSVSERLRALKLNLINDHLGGNA